MILAPLLLIPAFAILDRWCGGGMGWRSTFIGRPIYYVAALHPAAYLLDWRLGVILTGWCLWRWPAWKLFGGSLAPRNRKEIEGTFYRHLLIMPVSFATISASLQAQWFAVVLLVLWAMHATCLATVNRREADKGFDENDKVELARGAVFGVVAFAIMGVA
jgi:hypothetical protein